MKNNGKVKTKNKEPLHVREQREVDMLKTRINAEAPLPGSMIVRYKRQVVEKKDKLIHASASDVVAAAEASHKHDAFADDMKQDSKEYIDGYKEFSELPLSRYTLKGLEKAKFTHLTDIQRFAIPHALAGRDILGAAKTGSGKTLAFLVPILERLYHIRWSQTDGLGAVVLSPTRELAMQIFDVLRIISTFHQLSIGLAIGGHKYDEEKRFIHRMNILICTPGRFLAHLEETADFSCDSVSILVLDEADRILDMGFYDQLTSILTYLPAGASKGGSRQTMLFSATQTKHVKDLARLSLSSPEYISVHEHTQTATPSSLKQSYAICNLEDKLSTVYSFIRSHLKAKSIIFFSSCKQVRFIDYCFRHLRPGIPVMCLHGKLTQSKRMYVYHDFVRKPAAVLLATDIAARGLDFPDVNWVLQADCPEDTASYIHRVGRTARYKNGGNAILLLLPSEAPAMVPLLEKAKVPLTKIRLNPKKQENITPKLASFLASDPEVKELGQKAFRSYLRSVHLQTNKQVFSVKSLPISAYATSLGLPSTPRLKFEGDGGEQGRSEIKEKKGKSKKLAKLKEIIKLKKLMKLKGEGGANESENESSNENNTDNEKEKEEIDLPIEDADTGILDIVDRLNMHGIRRDKEKIESDAKDGEDLKVAPAKKSKWEKLVSKKARSEMLKRNRENDDGDDENDDEDGLGGVLMPVNKTAIPDKNAGNEKVINDLAEARTRAKLKQKVKITRDGVTRGRIKGSHVVFDEEEKFRPVTEPVGVSETDRDEYLNMVRARLENDDKDDKARDRERIRANREKKKRKLANQSKKELPDVEEQEDMEE